MKKSMVSFMMLILVVLILAACSKEKYPPTAINEAVDRCVICSMAIKDDQYATQIITTGGQALKFDDIGCLNTWKQENGQATIGAAYVRDYSSMEWIKYDKAYYVYDQEIQTPMAYGIISFEDEEAAKAYIAEHGVGTVLTASDLENHSWETSHSMGDHGHSHGHDEGTSEHSDMEMNEENMHGHGENDSATSHNEPAAH